MEREVQALKEKLAKVDEWRQRKEEIETQLGQVWVQGETKELEAPGYLR